MIDVNGRVCTKCGEYKTWEHYGKNSASPTKRMCKCKDCIKITTAENKETKRVYDLKRRLENIEAISEQRKQHYIDNKPKILANNRVYRAENRAKINKQKRVHRELNREAINAQKCTPHAKALRKTNRKNRWENDVNFKITDILRSRLAHAVRSQGTVKVETTLKLVGCTVEELREHIEAQWTEGMTWENHTLKGWHLDHVKPCASYNLTDPVQQKECFHYTNLQPLWAEDNLRKNSTYVE